MSKQVPPTHLSDHPDVLFAGKTFYVIDDQKRVWCVDQSWADAGGCKERVAGNGWSRTPRVEPMPKDPEVCTRLRELAGKNALAMKTVQAPSPTPSTLPHRGSGPHEDAAPQLAPEAVPAPEDGNGDLSDEDLDDLMGVNDSELQ